MVQICIESNLILLMEVTVSFLDNKHTNTVKTITQLKAFYEISLYYDLFLSKKTGIGIMVSSRNNLS